MVGGFGTYGGDDFGGGLMTGGVTLGGVGGGLTIIGGWPYGGNCGGSHVGQASEMISVSKFTSSTIKTPH